MVSTRASDLPFLPKEQVCLDVSFPLVLAWLALATALAAAYCCCCWYGCKYEHTREQKREEKEKERQERQEAKAEMALPPNYQEAMAGQPAVPSESFLGFPSSFYLGGSPVVLTCTHCQHHVTTRIEASPTALTWAFCCCLCITFFCIPFAWLPFCLKCFYVTRHFCPNCNTLLGHNTICT